MPFNGPVLPFGAIVEYHLFSANDLSRLHQFCPKVLPSIFLGYVLYAVGIWKGDILVADIEEMEETDTSELHARRLNTKEVLTLQRSCNFIFPVEDGTVKIFGGEQRLRTSTLTRDRPERREEQEVLRRESDGLSSTTPLQDDSTLHDSEVKNHFWTITGDFICRHHVEPRVKLYVSKEEPLLIWMKDIDVTRNTHTSLDVISDASKREAKQKWVIEKPKLDNARRLRGIFFIEPDDEEFERTMETAVEIENSDAM